MIGVTPAALASVQFLYLIGAGFDVVGVGVGVGVVVWVGVGVGVGVWDGMGVVVGEGVKGFGRLKSTLHTVERVTCVFLSTAELKLGEESIIKSSLETGRQPYSFIGLARDMTIGDLIKP